MLCTINKRIIRNPIITFGPVWLCFFLTACAPHDEPTPSKLNPPSTAISHSAVNSEKDQAILTTYSRYIEKEGAKNRASLFASLAQHIGEKARVDKVTELEVLLMLGPPDYCRTGGHHLEFIYSFHRTDKPDWYSGIDFDQDGFVELVGFNGIEELEVEKYYKYTNWPQIPKIQ